MNTLQLEDILQQQQKQLERSRAKSSSTDATQSDGSMQQTLVAALRDGVCGVFSSMCDCDLEHVSSSPTDTRKERYSLSGIIGITGATKTTIVVNLQLSLACVAAEKMLGVKPKDADILDVVGELANMIGGSAKDSLQQEGLSLGLPAVVEGKGHTVAPNPGAELHYLSFNSKYGQLTVELMTTSA